MRLTFIHGRGQGRQTAGALRSEWLAALTEGLKKAKLPPLGNHVDIQLPYYADILDRLTAAAKAKTSRARTRGPEEGTSRFATAFILEIANGAGVDNSEIATELGSEPIERGDTNGPWLLAAGRALDRKLPWLSQELLRRLTDDVDAYMNRLDVRNEVHEVLAPAVIGEPTVVVGHSLGSIVSYCLLRDFESITQVPLLVTVGSPLGMVTVKNCLPRPWRLPKGVVAWFNASDVRDKIAMIPRLDRDVFRGIEIENLSDLHNPRDNPHGIAGYLADPIVARHIAKALA